MPKALSSEKLFQLMHESFANFEFPDLSEFEEQSVMNASVDVVEELDNQKNFVTFALVVKDGSSDTVTLQTENSNLYKKKPRGFNKKLFLKLTKGTEEKLFVLYGASNPFMLQTA